MRRRPLSKTGGAPKNIISDGRGETLGENLFPLTYHPNRTSSSQQIASTLNQHFPFSSKHWPTFQIQRPSYYFVTRNAERCVLELGTRTLGLDVQVPNRPKYRPTNGSFHSSRKSSPGSKSTMTQIKEFIVGRLSHSYGFTRLQSSSIGIRRRGIHHLKLKG